MTHVDYPSHVEALAALAEMFRDSGLSYAAVFVPFSSSRNAQEKELNSDGKLSARPRYSLNWRCTFAKGNQYGGAVSRTVDYMQGVAHIPGYDKAPKSPVYDFNKAVLATVETGRNHLHNLTGRPINYMRPGQLIPHPDPVEVLQCLMTDASAINYTRFEDWAQDCGYDTDSRKAEGIYRECLETALFFRNVLGEELFSRMQDAAQQC